MSSAENLLAPIPHPPKKPIVGNMLSVSSSAPIQGLMALARELGPIYWLDMMGKPIVVVSGADLVAELSDETRFDKAVRGALRRIRAFAGDGLFTAYSDEPNWSKAHNILLPNFSQRAMIGYHGAMIDIAVQLTQKWDRLNTDEDIDVSRDMTNLTLDTIGLAGFDYRFNSFYRETNHPFVNAMVRALEITMETRGLPFEDLIRKDREYKIKYDTKYMNKVVDRIIRERRELGDAAAGKQDLLSYMLAGIDKNSGQRLDDLNIRNQIITFLIAGHETTSGLMSFAIYYLLQHPNILDKAIAEVDRVLGTDRNAIPTYQQVTQMTYVGQILKETLRLWPTAPAYSLQPHGGEQTIGGKYKMKKEYQISVLIPMLHRDPKVWGDRAEIFNPDNFTREAEAKLPPGAYKPFGSGQRACIGRQFALQEAQLVLGMILHRFELIDHLRYRLKIKESLTLKPEDLRIRVKPRHSGAKSATGTPAAGRMAASAASPALMPAAATAAPTAPRNAHGTPLLVLYGSNLGSAEGIARQMADAGDANGFAVTIGALDDYAERLPTRGAVLVTSASYNGGAPDNAVHFCEWLTSSKLTPGALAGVNYAVFGCGNRDWASTFQTIPRLIDDKLAAAGATRLMERGEGDARDDFDGQFQAWYAPLWTTLATKLSIDLAAPEAAQTGYEVQVVHSGLVSPFIESLGARAMAITSRRELHTTSGAHPSERSTVHADLKLPDGVTYRAGDHLGVIARNNEPLVRRVAARFDLQPETRVKLAAVGGKRTFLPVDQPVSLSRLLGEYVELQDVASRKQIATMAAHTRCPHTRPQLEALSASTESAEAKYRAEVFAKRKSVIDLLEEFPACELQFSDYLALLPPLRPRYYSIASSPLKSPATCAITVAVVEDRARSGRGTYLGVCSNYIRGLGVGDIMHAFVKDTKSAFRLPADPATPIVMIGPGTGLAPFRGFLEERAALAKQGRRVGPALLFFGCRHPETDYLYRDELEAYERDGIVKLSTAFSRVDGRTRTYVQDQITERGDEVWDLLLAGATIYVCGDAGKMAPAVRKALAALIARNSHIEIAVADQRLDQMTTEGRYLVDVWASG